jgi:hypothetical protein
MNIDIIPPHMMTRGLVVSMIDREKPFFESFTNGKDVATVVYIGGVPMSLNIFLVAMAIRFAPNRTRACIPGRVSDNRSRIIVTDEELVSLNAIWGKVEMSPDVRREILSVDTNDTIHVAITRIFDSHLKLTDPTEIEKSFKEFMRRVDDEYTSSLIDPINI